MVKMSMDGMTQKRHMKLLREQRTAKKKPRRRGP
jgi:hypothetical protein